MCKGIRCHSVSFILSNIVVVFLNTHHKLLSGFPPVNANAMINILHLDYIKSIMSHFSAITLSNDMHYN